MFKRAAAVAMLALIAMTFDHAVGKKGHLAVETTTEANLFDLSEEDEMDKAAEAAGSVFEEGYVPCEKALIETLRGGERKNDTGQMVRMGICEPSEGAMLP